jgi:endo-1,4-beta-D-glucanase Y
MDAAVAACYDQWKARYVHPGCAPGQAYVFYNLEGQAERKDAISVSEGHGYGMLLAAYLAGHDPSARQLFDSLHAYFRAHPSSFHPDLMSWQQVEGCRDRPGDDDSASDGDLDIAYALLLADRQWGSAGAVNYLAEARKVIAAIREADLNRKNPSVKLGNAAQAGEEVNDIRTSDFMPDHFRAFGRATNAPIWAALIDHGYTVVQSLQTRHAPTTGLLPDFVRRVNTDAPIPAKPKFLESKYDGDYYYNACRVPWRLGLDYLINGDERSRAVLAKINEFIERAAGGNPDSIRAGYFLKTGKAIDPDDETLAFTAPFAVAAMIDARDQPWLDRLWTRLSAERTSEETYFDQTVALLCMVAISGNWWSP